MASNNALHKVLLPVWNGGLARLPDAIQRLSTVPTLAEEMMAFCNNGSFQAAVTNYAKDNPVIFGAQVLGGVLSIASLAVVPVLGAAGFAAAGPVAGSAAAAWQSSVGVVQAGSIFAWCQSAAMGGTAVGGIVAAGLGGAGLAVGATVATA